MGNGLQRFYFESKRNGLGDYYEADPANGFNKLTGWRNASSVTTNYCIYDREFSSGQPIAEAKDALHASMIVDGLNFAYNPRGALHERKTA